MRRDQTESAFRWNAVGFAMKGRDKRAKAGNVRADAPFGRLRAERTGYPRASRATLGFKPRSVVVSYLGDTDLGNPCDRGGELVIKEIFCNQIRSLVRRGGARGLQAILLPSKSIA
jgi:hypothetical protein